MVQWLRLYIPSAGGLGSLPGQGPGSHMPQLKILYATARTWCSQMKIKKTNSFFAFVSNILGCRLLDSVGEGKGGMFQENSIETCILSRVKQITSPGWMHETSARTWCTGKTQRDQVGEGRGRGIGMRNTCKSMADSCQCMTKTTKKNK